MAEINKNAVNEVHETAGTLPPPSEMSLEQLVLLINTERLNQLKDKTQKELKELKERQQKVRELHKLLRSINEATDGTGKLDFAKDKELKDLIKKAKEHGVEIDGSKTKYSKEERERLLENIRVAVEDLNVENEMQMQTLSRLTSERYETYQMARSILKPLHEDKLRKAREISGKS